MGNQQISEAISQVQKINDGQKLKKIEEAYNKFSFTPATGFSDFYNAIDKTEFIPSDEAEKLFIPEKFRELFTQNSHVPKSTVMSNSDRLKIGQQELWQLGQTSWQHDLNSIASDRDSNLVMSINKNSQTFEFDFLSRAFITCSKLAMRYKQAVPSRKPITIMAEEEFERSDQPFSFRASAQSIFFDLLQSMAPTVIENPAPLTGIVDTLLRQLNEVSMDALFNDEKDGLVDHLVYSRICNFLCELIEKEELDDELRAKCVELVLRIGLVTGNAQQLVMAAYLQSKYSVNIAQHLESYVGVSEKFVEPASSEQTAAVKMEATGRDQIQSKCRFQDDNNRQNAKNKGACNGDFYFNWQGDRGLTRAKRKPDDFNWEHEHTNNEKTYDGVTFLVMKKKLYMRHKETPVDTPFQQINISEMKIDTTAPKIQFADEMTKMRFKHTTSDDSKITNDAGNRRWVDILPMTSDGKFIYTMVEYHESNFESDRKALAIEKYELKSNKIKFVSSKQLKTAENVTWPGRKGNDNSDGGYVNFGMLACNGPHAVWCARRYVHIFDMETGMRIGKNKIHSGREHITMMDPESYKFYGQDADVYSWLVQYEIPGFEAPVEEEEETSQAQLPPIKFNLDEKKNAVKNSASKNNKPGFKANVIAQLIGGEANRAVQEQSKASYEAKLQQLESAAEEDKGEDEVTFNTRKAVHDWSRAILLAHVSKGAQLQNFYARKSESTFSTAETIKKFFKTKQSIMVSQGMFEFMRKAIMHLLEEYELQTCDISEQHALLSLINIYISHIGCLRRLNISINDLLSTEEKALQGEMVARLRQIQLYEGQSPIPKPEEQLSDAKLFQLHIYHAKKQLSEEVATLLQDISRIDQLKNLNAELEKMGQAQGEYPDICSHLKIFHLNAIQSLFEEEKSLIDTLLAVLKTAAHVMGERTIITLKKIMSDKQFDGPHSGFAFEEDRFLQEFISIVHEELIIDYVFQNKIITDASSKQDDDIQVEKKKSAEEKREKLNELLFYSMIAQAKGVKHALKTISSIMGKIKAAEWQQWTAEERTKFFSNINSCLFGNESTLRALTMFGYHTVLYDISFTDLDEVSEIMAEVTDGLRFFMAGLHSLTLHDKEIADEQTALVEKLEFVNRQLQLVHSRSSAMLIDEGKDVPQIQFEKFNTLRTGIAFRCIPKLSDATKKQLEGSFKIVDDQAMRDLTERAYDEEQDQNTNDELVGRFFKQGDQKISELTSMFTQSNIQASVTFSDSASNYSADSLDAADAGLYTPLLKAAFAIMVKFGKQLPLLKDLVERVDSNEIQGIEQIDAATINSLTMPWKQAQKLKGWIKKQKRAFKKKIMAEKTEKRLSEWNESHANEPKKEQLTSEEVDVVKQEVLTETKVEHERLIKNALSILDYLRFIETEEIEVQYDAAGLGQSTYSEEWEMPVQDRQVHSVFKNKRPAVVQEDQEMKHRENASKVHEEIIAILETGCKVEELREFVEAKLVRGLRRMAGIHGFNEIMTKSNDAEFYDALDQMVAALRGRKARSCHYLRGVSGCGRETQDKIRKVFATTIIILAERIKYERDEERLCQLLNALLWNFDAEDMSIIAKSKIIEILSGCQEELVDDSKKPSLEKLYGNLRQAWGREPSFLPLDGQTSWTNESNGKYCLSGRLRQCFDHYVTQIYKVAFKDKSIISGFAGDLSIIIRDLMMQINSVIFQKIEQFLSMAETDPVLIAEDRDDFIFVSKFASEGQEPEDDKDKIMVDQHQAMPGVPAAKIHEQLQKNSEKKRQIVDACIKALDLEQSFDSAESFLGKFYKPSTEAEGAEEEGLEHIREAMLRRDWLALQNIEQNLKKYILGMQETHDGLDENAYQSIDKEIADELVIEAAEAKPAEAGENSADNEDSDKKESLPIIGFSKVALTNIVKHVVLFLSLAESSDEAAQLPFEVMKPAQLQSLIKLSIVASPSIQLLMQKVFQSFLKISTPVAVLNNATLEAAGEIDGVPQYDILEIEDSCIDFQSTFWQLLFNQIQITKRAQFSAGYQVEVGKAVVVEEISRTFLTQQIIESAQEQSQTDAFSIKAKIDEALTQVQKLSDESVASIFAVVPEANLPVICRGQRCKSEQDEFIVLGYRENGDQSDLLMVPSQNMIVQGLLLDHQSGSQEQKTFDLRNLQAIENTGEATMSSDDRKKLEKSRLTNSPFMNPAVFKAFLNVLELKEASLHQNPEKESAHRYVKLFAQKGIYTMFKSFEEQYIYILKMYNIFENVLNYLATTVTQHKLGPEEPLSGYNLQQVQAAELHMAATHVNMSTGLYKSFNIFVSNDLSLAMMMRHADNTLATNFMEVEIDQIHGADPKAYKCQRNEHDLQSIWALGKADDHSQELSCAGPNCPDSKIRVTEKKTGFMRCLDCNNDTDLCNRCSPKPQINKKAGYSIQEMGSSVFRLPRVNAVMIPADELKDFQENLRVLAALRQASVVFTRRFADGEMESLLEELKKLAEKDPKWKPCLETQIIEVDTIVYRNMKRFVKGEKMTDETNPKSNMLCQLYQNFDFVQEKVLSKEKSFDFIVKFMKLPISNDSIANNKDALINFFRDLVSEDIEKDERQKETLIEQITTRLDNIGRNQIPVENQRIKDVAPVQRMSNTTPAFMQKFMGNTTKFTDDNGKDYFNEGEGGSKSDWKLNYQSQAFRLDEAPHAVLDKELNNLLNQTSSHLVRKTWLHLLSLVNGIEPENRRMFNLSGKHQIIFDLIHECHMEAAHERIFLGNPQPEQETQQQIKEILRFFDEDDSNDGKKFRSAFYQDLLRRADQTIDAVRRDDYTELQSYNLKDLRKLSKLPNVLDPLNLLFLSRQLFEMGQFLNSAQRGQMAKVLFDLHLGFAIVFKDEQDAVVSQQLLQGSVWALEQMQQQLKTLKSEQQIMQDLHTSSLLREVFKHMKNAQNQTSKVKLILEVQLKLSQIFKEARQMNPNLSKQTVYAHDGKLGELISGYQAFSQGKAFTSYMARWKLLTLMREQQKEVLSYGQLYCTEPQMLSTYFEKSESANEDLTIKIENQTASGFIQIENLTTKKKIVMCGETFAKASSLSMDIKKGEDYKIAFPVAVNETMQQGKIYNRYDSEYSVDNSEFSKVDGLQIDPTRVLSCHHQVMFISADETIMGMGFRVQGKAEQSAMRVIEKPSECRDFKRVAIGKFFRVILTKQNKLFFNGQNKHYTVARMCDELNQWTDQFHEITSLFPLEAGDKIVDVDGGQHFIIVCTEKGKIYCSGYKMWNYTSSDVRNGGGEEAFEMKLEAGVGGLPAEKQWIAERVWANKNNKNCWALLRNRNNSDERLTVGIGAPSHVGAGESVDNDEKWHPVMITQGRHLIEIQGKHQYTVAIDNCGDLWEWGQYNSNQGNEESAGEKLFETSDGSEPAGKKPKRFVWFTSRNMKVKRIGAFRAGTLIEVKTETGKMEYYASKENSEEQLKGSGFKAVYGEKFGILENWGNDGAGLVDFCSGTYAIFTIKEQKVEIPRSIVPTNSEDRGLTHFYKKGNQWQVLDQATFNSTGMKILPSIMFATRHPIKDFERVREMLPDITNDTPFLWKKSLGGDGAAAAHNQAQKNVSLGRIDDPFTNEIKYFDKSELIYYGRTKRDGRNFEFVMKKEEAQAGGSIFDLSPMIFYVAKRTIDFSKLPQISDQDMFQQAAFDNEKRQLNQLTFSITRTFVDEEQIMSLPLQNPQTQRNLDLMQNFDDADDLEILRGIDKYRETELNDQDIATIRPSAFSLETLPLSKVSTLTDRMSEDVIRQRITLLIDFNRSAAGMLDNIYFTQEERQNSIQEMFMKCRNLLLPSLKIKFIKEYVSKRSTNEQSDLKPSFEIQYTEVQAFRKTAVKHDPRFINESCFAWYMLAVQGKDPDFTGLASTERNFNYYVRPDDKGYDWLFEEIYTEFNSPENPLLIKTLNGQQKVGGKRDCFIVNPRMSDQKMLKAFQFIGGLIAQRFEKGPDTYSFNIPFAPSFWKLCLNEEVTLEDFAFEHASLRRRLNNLESAIRSGSETWSWIDSFGVVKRLGSFAEGEPVTADSEQEFRNALLQAYIGENEAQMQAVRKGFKHIMDSKGDQNLHYMTKLINWHDLMMMIEGKKHKDHQLSKIRDELDYDSNDEPTKRAVSRFFDYINEFNYETKKSFLVWSCGVTRMFDPHGKFDGEKMQFKIDPSMQDVQEPLVQPEKPLIKLPGGWGVEDDEEFKGKKQQLETNLLNAMKRGPTLEAPEQ